MKLDGLPFAVEALLTSLHARRTLAPLLAKSRAVSLPIPVLAPVMMTVLPSNLLGLRHTPFIKTL